MFASGRTKWRIFMFVATLTSELSTWQQLELMASRGQAISEGKGLIQLSPNSPLFLFERGEILMERFSDQVHV